MLKFLFFIVVFLLTLSTLAQKEGTHLSVDDPLCETWKLIDESSDAPMIAGIGQNFVSLVSSGSTRSFMAESKMSNNSFECPSYFKVSRDEKYLYFEILVPCKQNLTEEEKFITVEYNLGEVKEINTIEINGSKHEIEEMKTILTLTFDGENYHYSIIEQ